MSAGGNDDLVGQRLGNYQLVQKLGQGGMGAVYVGEHRRITRRVAIKVLLPELAANPSVVERFLAEARMASLVRHPGVVEIFDCDLHEGHAFIVMQLLEGQSLASYVRRPAIFSPDGRLAARVGEQVARAVAAAHARNVIHRDLKPDNIFLVDREGAAAEEVIVKVVDFGIAKLAAADASSHTRTGMLLGTPAYMSPEQCRGAGKVDQRTDIYSVGCVIFEMVCGRTPFVCEGSGEYLVAQISEPPPLPRSLNPEVPPAIEHIILEMLAKSPTERPQSMVDVADRLAGIAATLPGGDPIGTMLLENARAPVVPLPPPSRRRAAASESVHLGPPTTLTSSASELKVDHATGTPGRRRLLTFAAVGAVAVGALVFALVSHGSDDPAGEPKVLSPATRLRPEPPGVAHPAPDEATPTPSPRPPASTVTITVTNAPPSLEATLDGTPVTFPVELPRQPGTQHSLILSAKGYADQLIVFDGGDDHELRAALQRRPVRPSAPIRQPSSSQAKPQSSSSPTRKNVPPTERKSAIDGITDL